MEAAHIEPIANRTRGLKDLRLLRGGVPSTGKHLDWLRCAGRLRIDDCRDIVEACREFPISAPTTVDEERYPAHRQADTRKVGANAKTGWILELLCQVGGKVNRTAHDLDLTGITRSPQYVEYRPGWGRFDWHNDYSHGHADAPRKMTIIVQLSAPDEYEGGALQVFGTEVEDLPRDLGSIVAFPSFLYHRVTPVTVGARRALVAWIAGPRIR